MIIIVDNSAESYILQKRNGLPCTSWFSDSNDRELLTIKQFLSFIIYETTISDVRKVLDLVIKDKLLD